MTHSSITMVFTLEKGPSSSTAEKIGLSLSGNVERRTERKKVLFCCLLTRCFDNRWISFLRPEKAFKFGNTTIAWSPAKTVSTEYRKVQCRHLLLELFRQEVGTVGHQGYRCQHFVWGCLPGGHCQAVHRHRWSGTSLPRYGSVTMSTTTLNLERKRHQSRSETHRNMTCTEQMGPSRACQDAQRKMCSRTWLLNC